VDADVVHKLRVEYDFMVNLHGKESQKAQDVYEELQHQLQLPDAEKTPSQKATDKRRLLKNARNKLVKAAAALDAAEEALTAAHNKYSEAETHLETTALQVDRLEEELQYLEEQYLRPSAASGPQRDFVTERAHDAVDRAVLRGGQDEDTAEVQQLTNRLLELLDKKEGAQPRKKTRFDDDAADADLPPVPDAPDKESEPDEDMENQDDSDYCGPNARTSTKILAQYSSKVTRDYVRHKGSVSKPAGKGSGMKGEHKGPAPAGGQGPTPSEAHGPKKPGLQSDAGGEGGAGTATPVRREDSPPAARDDSARNRWGDGPPLS
jgi:predicted  nucleic acid-binding Zn-ribbon protein